MRHSAFSLRLGKKQDGVDRGFINGVSSRIAKNLSADRGEAGAFSNADFVSCDRHVVITDPDTRSPFITVGAIVADDAPMRCASQLISYWIRSLPKPLRPTCRKYRNGSTMAGGWLER